MQAAAGPLPQAPDLRLPTRTKPASRWKPGGASLSYVTSLRTLSYVHYGCLLGASGPSPSRGSPRDRISSPPSLANDHDLTPADQLAVPNEDDHPREVLPPD